MEPNHPTDADELKQQIAAELLWLYVTRLREAPAGAPPPCLTRAELADLAQVLEGAGALAAALPGEEPMECRAAVQRRVEALLAARPQVESRRESVFRRLSSLARAPRLQLRAAAGLAAVLALALATVGVWHRPATEVRMVAVPMEVQDVEPMAEADVHALLPRMVRHELSPEQEKSLMWHMLVCPGCYDTYLELRQSRPVASHRGFEARFTAGGR